MQLLGTRDVSDVATSVRIIARHELGNGYRYELSETREGARPDGFWTVHTLKVGAFTALDVTVTLAGALDASSYRGSRTVADPGPNSGQSCAHLTSAWLRMQYSVYGKHGLAQHEQHVVLPLAAPARDTAPTWRLTPSGRASTLCIPTHLLCHFDDPVSTVAQYAAPLAQEGDVVCIAESALAIMQVQC